MLVKKIKLLIVSLGIVCLTQAQDAAFGIFNEALLFSQTTFGGTARIQAIGGAQVSLGGDLSSINSNPAGLGFFNRSSFTFTPGLNFINSDSRFLGNRESDFRNNFNVAQLGLAFHYKNDDGKFKGGTLGISFNRINDFQNQVTYSGRNDANSILDSFLENAGSTNPGDLTGFEATAFDHFLIDLADFDDPIDFFVDPNTGVITPNDGDGTFEGYASLFGSFAGSLPRQREVVTTRGGQNQFNISYGGNFDDKIYFGAGVGVLSVNLERERFYEEDQFQFADGSPDDILTSVQILDELRITGVGVNASFGVIARPIDFITVGVNYTTPSFYSLDEESSFIFTTNWNSFYSYELPDEVVPLGTIITESDISIFEYNLRTPSKLNFGATAFIGKQGFISADVELVDYSSAELRSNFNEFSLSADNREIRRLYGSAVNYRVGAEYRLNPVRFRAGYSFQADPFEDGSIDRSVSNISGGIGFRAKKWFVDLAIVNSQFDNLVSPFFLEDGSAPVARINNSNTRGVLTLGFSF